MSTSAETVFLDEGRVCAVLWRQYDGYPAVHGEELKDLLGTFHLTEQGLGLAAAYSGVCLLDLRRVANGIGCMAAQVVAHFKEGPGYFYLAPPNAFKQPASFRYTVYAGAGGSVRLKCEEPFWAASTPCQNYRTRFRRHFRVYPPITGLRPAIVCLHSLHLYSGDFFSALDSAPSS